MVAGRRPPHIAASPAGTPGQTEDGEEPRWRRPRPRCPVTVLTGYLGAGKTTLLNRILTENHGRKYAVVINEFGELGVDNDLVVDTDEEVFEMNNGCICCTVRGDLIRIVGGLMKRRDRFDGIIIETTGLANPAPVAQTFFVDDDVRAQDPARRHRHRGRRQAPARSSWTTATRRPSRSPSPSDRAEQDRPRHARRTGSGRGRRSARSTASPRSTAPSRADVPIAEMLDLGAFDLDRVLAPARLPRRQSHEHNEDVALMSSRSRRDRSERFQAWIGALLPSRARTSPHQGHPRHAGVDRASSSRPSI